MTMLVSQEAAKAQVIVLAIIATHQVAFIGFCTCHQSNHPGRLRSCTIHTTAASIAHRLLLALNSHIRTVYIGGASRRCHLGDGLGLGWHNSRGGLALLHLRAARGNGLGCAVGDSAIHHQSLDQPVAFSTARCTGINTLWAQVVVPILADTAVIVFVGDRATAVVAINAEHSAGGVVGNDGEADIVLLQVELAITRLADRQTQRGESEVKRLGGSRIKRGRGSFGLGNGDGRAKNGVEIAVPLVVRLSRDGGVCGRRRRVFDRAGLDTKL